MKKIFNTLLLLSISITVILAQPANNEPCGAIVLPVNSTCTPQTYTTTGATLTSSPGLSGCSYSDCSSGDDPVDVWFTFTVATTDPIYLETSSVSGGMEDPAMYIYTGDVCAGAGTLFHCQDQALAPNNNFPNYVISGLAIGTQVYIRITNQLSYILFGYCTDTNLGNFQLCATTSVCGGSAMPGQTCATATPICDLNGFCGRTVGYTVDEWSALDNDFASYGWDIHNNGFITFIASATTVNLDVNVTSCTSNNGIQFLLFTTTACGSGPVTSYFCNGDITPGATSISMSGLTVGDTYILMIDGSAGDVCSYTINATSGISLGVSAGADINLCGAGSATLNVSGGTGPYTWTDSQGNTVGTGTSVTVSPTATETYTVTGLSGNPLCPNSASDDVVVNVVLNNFTVIAQPSDTTICSGQSINITASGATTYAWTPATGLSATTGATVTANPTTSQVYTLTGTTNGCDHATTVTINVTPTPATPAITSNSPVCEGVNIQLNTAGGNDTYVWTGPNSFTSSVQNPTVQNPTIVNGGNYSLYVIENGCTSATQSSNVVVNPTPAEPNFSVSSPSCIGEIITFDGPTYPPGYTYVWSGPNGWTSSLADPQLGPATTNMSGSYSLYIAANGCTSIAQTQSILVLPQPTVTYTGPTEACGYTAVVSANAQVAAPDQIATYEWYHEGNYMGQAQILSYFFNEDITSTANGTLEVTTSFGCSITIPFSIVLYTIPTAAFDFDLPCTGLIMGFDENAFWPGVPTPGTTFSYNWNFGDGQTSTTSDPDHTYLENGKYDVTLIIGSSESSCKDTITHEVIVSENPEAQITYEEKCFQNVVFQSASITHGSTIESFSWDFDDGSVSTDSSLIHEYDQPGNYSVSLTVITEEGCTSFVFVPIVVTPSTKLSELEIPNIITANADGVNDALILDVGMENCNVYEMHIFNRWGNIVYKQQKGSLPFNGRSLSGSRLSAGVYFYTIKADDLERKGTITIAY